jgi:hypothetical protein
MLVVLVEADILCSARFESTERSHETASSEEEEEEYTTPW